MNLLDIFYVSSMAVLKLILVSGVGSLLALERINILGPDARKHFNNVVFYVFNPALIATSLSKTITIKSMEKLWFMPVNILLTFIIGSALGWIIIRITKVPPHLKGVILGCCAAGNMGNMLFIIIPEICKGKGSPFGSQDVCTRDGMAYSSLAMAIAIVYMWSYVYNIIRISSKKAIKVTEASVSINKEAEVSVSINSTNKETSKSDPETCIEEPLPVKDCSVSEDNADDLALPCNRSEETHEVKKLVKSKRNLKKLARKMNLKMLLSPSTLGAIVGFLVGAVPPFRKSMIGDSAPLRVIQDSASLLGDGAIPVLSLILGANLIKGLKGSGTGISVIVWIMVVRYILLPLSGVFIVKGAAHVGLIHSDPLYLFVLLLQFSAPPAMNIGTITQLFGAGESECSVIMLWTYALAPVALTLWSILFIWLVS